jgi:hypothetical protein
MMEMWAVKTDDAVKPVAKMLIKTLYTYGETKKRDRVLEIVCPEHFDWSLDISMSMLAKTLGEKGILHLVDEYCKLASSDIKGEENKP